MRKLSLVRIIAEHIVDNDISEEGMLSQLPVDIQEMYQIQIELKKARIVVRAEIEKAHIEQEIRFRDLEINRQNREVRH